jgi:hypothetical protein
MSTCFTLTGVAHPESMSAMLVDRIKVRVVVCFWFIFFPL